ncbi:MAG: helix-turn-helix domain-containing protein [Alphaproteobacteria bacterium]|nr:helix-turn-helix domain-containing protein [Alphaproteobacteria bacterium]
MPKTRKLKSKKSPDHVDVVIAAALKTFRALRKMSQEQLAGELGLTFQQIQKYEKAYNRISASRLYRIACLLEVSVLDFYMGLDGARPKVKDIWLSDDEIKLLTAFRNIHDSPGQKHAIKLVKDVASYRIDGDD